MKLKVFDCFTAEGTEAELAMFTMLILECFQLKDEQKKKKDVEDWMKKYGEKTFAELMKMERDEEEE